MEPHTSSPSPCKYEVKLNQVKAIGSFTSFQMFHTHTRFYTRKVLHTQAVTQGRFYTQTLIHTHKLLHASSSVTHRRFYTRQAFTYRGRGGEQGNRGTHRRFYTVTHTSFYTQKLLPTEVITQTTFHTQNAATHTLVFTHKKV